MNALARIALVCSLAACSQATPGVNFAITETSAARWIAMTHVTVIDKAVNMMEPLAVEAAEDGRSVTLSYARRGRDGMRVSIDAESLVPAGTTPFVFELHEHRTRAPCVEGRPAAVTTRMGPVRVSADASGRLFAEGPSGHSPLAIGPADVHAVGQPVAAAVSDRRVIIAFFAEADEGFEVAAAALDVK